MKILRANILIGVLFALLAISMWAQPSPSADSGVEGTVSVSPVHGGPARVGVPSTTPLVGVEFVIEGEKGEAGSFKTDDKGHFRVLLPPGHYSMSRKDSSKIGFYGPFEVDVVSGKMTQVEWACDSGMR